MSNPLPQFDNHEIFKILSRMLKYPKSAVELHSALQLVPALRPLYDEAFGLFEEEQKLKERIGGLAAKALNCLEYPEFLSAMIRRRSEEVVELLAQRYSQGDSKISLIKLYRSKTGCSLVEAKAFIENSGFLFPNG